MPPQLKNVLQGPITKEDRHAFSSQVYQDIYFSTIIISLLVLVLDAGMMIASFLYPEYFGTPARLRTYRYLYIWLFAFTLPTAIYIISAKKKMKDNPVLFLNITYGYGLFICLWSGVLNAFERIYSGDLTVLVYIYVFVAISVVMEPWKAVLLYTCNFLWYWVWLHIFGLGLQSVLGNVLNAIVVTVLSITIASSLYISRGKTFLAQQIILRQKQEIEEINNELNKLIMVDNLTKLQNRRFYDEALPGLYKNTQKKGKALAAFMIDIDFFKQFNDEYGHQAGDACLQQVSAMVCEVVRAEENVFIRYGGEEFLLILFGITEEVAKNIGNRICKHIEQARIPHIKSPMKVVTVSIGIRMSQPKQEETLFELVADADKALYISKNTGRNRVTMYSDSIH